MWADTMPMLALHTGPVYPVLHAHVNDPAVFVHADKPAAQLCGLSLHSLFSATQVGPE
jgi:hypothetical protein